MIANWQLQFNNNKNNLNFIDPISGINKEANVRTVTDWWKEEKSYKVTLTVKQTLDKNKGDNIFNIGQYIGLNARQVILLTMILLMIINNYIIYIIFLNMMP